MRHDGTARELRSYVTGFALALLLTAIPFALVAWGGIGREAMLAVIAVTALLQAAVHLRYFLGIDARSTPHENRLAFAFAAVLIGIMIGGSLWIMMDLHHRMAPMSH